MTSKSELLESMHAKYPTFSKHDVRIMMDIFFNSIIRALENGSRVEIRNLGSFSIRSYSLKQDSVHNSRLKKKNYLKVYFRPSKIFVNRINSIDSDTQD